MRVCRAIANNIVFTTVVSSMLRVSSASVGADQHRIDINSPEYGGLLLMPP